MSNGIYNVGLNGSDYDSFMAAIAGMDLLIDVRASPNGSTAGIFKADFNYHNGDDRNYKGVGLKPGLKNILGERYVPMPTMGVPKVAREGLNRDDQLVMNDQLNQHRDLFPVADLAKIMGYVDSGLKVALLCQESFYDPAKKATACHRRYVITELLGLPLVELDARK